ncbi:hypothetical protein J2S00_001311 [Caldalkalibacillus uzonensis]|uniref:Nucleotidyltransferase family protein n=1 Tax=Caldalkalibacillus uzonensis TaxID=353224 RepID=A0ABU0CQ54_9BACI|nr:hypothetical protein [Caldalkalibacillus uzonensis]
MLKLKGKPKFERMLTTDAILTELLEQQQIRPIIVGGLSIEIYTLQQYTTHDIDLIINGSAQASDVIKALGFERTGKDWLHPGYTKETGH